MLTSGVEVRGIASLCIDQDTGSEPLHGKHSRLLLDGETEGEREREREGKREGEGQLGKLLQLARATPPLELG